MRPPNSAAVISLSVALCAAAAAGPPRLRLAEVQEDADSRKELLTFFTPLTGKYEGAQRNLDQTLETVDQCIALVAAQSSSVKEFLERY